MKKRPAWERWLINVGEYVWRLFTYSVVDGVLTFSTAEMNTDVKVLISERPVPTEYHWSKCLRLEVLVLEVRLVLFLLDLGMYAYGGDILWTGPKSKHRTHVFYTQATHTTWRHYNPTNHFQLAYIFTTSHTWHMEFFSQGLDVSKQKNFGFWRILNFGFLDNKYLTCTDDNLMTLTIHSRQCDSHWLEEFRDVRVFLFFSNNNIPIMS